MTGATAELTRVEEEIAAIQTAMNSKPEYHHIRTRCWVLQASILAAEFAMGCRRLNSGMPFPQFFLPLLLALAVAFIGMVMTHSLGATALRAILYAATTLAVCGSGSTFLFFWPPETELTSKLNEWKRALVCLRPFAAEFQNLESQLRDLRLRASALRTPTRREQDGRMLLNRPWRTYKATDFELYLSDVFQHLGYEVDVIGKSGDQGADLIITRNGRRIAIQAKGYAGNVGNVAVQQVYAAAAHYRCSGCAVITNSRFTSSAIDLAKSTACILVDEENFHMFVQGKVPFA